jgi:uncharacterized protein with HEPN domain
MPPKSKSPLFDIAQAANGIAQFVQGRTLEDYRNDLMLRSAVERQFIIIGEAVTRLRKTDPALASRISQHDRVVSFRNVLTHGYDQVDDSITWAIIHEKLPILAKEVEELLKT